MLQKKVVAFLKMFAEVKGMQQLYKHKLLQVIFVSFLSNPDTLIVQLSLHCIIGFKLPYVTPHVHQLKGILSKHQMREILTKFNLSRENGDVDIQHRTELFPIVIRILFGRLSARGSGGKSSKDSPAVRRAAILSFLSGLDASKGELDYFVYMMVRSFIPKDVNMHLSDMGHGNISHFRTMIAQVQEYTSVEQVASVPSQRQEGFLNLLSEVVKKLGFDVSEFVPTFVKLILGILENSESFRKDFSSALMEIEDNDVKINDSHEHELENGASRSGKIRSMCFLRLSDFMSQFSETTDFSAFGPVLWLVAGPALKNLPNSTVNAINAPSLLILLEKMSSHPRLIPLLAQDESSVSAVFQCISESSKLNVIDCALSFVDNLLTEGGMYDPNEDVSAIDGDRVGIGLVRNQIDLLITQFTRRLKSTDESSKSSQLASRELSILCRVTEFLVSDESIDESKTDTLATLCGLLLPFLSFGRRINEHTQLDVLRILISLLPQIGEEAAFSHLQSFSRLLGPNKSGPGIKSLEVRQQIVNCIGAIAENKGNLSPGLKGVVREMQDLNASNPKRIEWDFERVLPVLNGLGGACSGERSWFSYSKLVDTSQHGLKILMPLMYCCLQLLHDADGVLSRGAFKALNTLIVVASEQQESDISWQRLVETSMMACIRIGLKTHSLAVRRSFILLLSTVAKSFASANSPNLCSDLFTLVRDDEPELDFFLNITHVQIHRRARALGRLRKFLSGFEEMEACTISTQSLTNILLPLALHPVYECDKNGEEAYAMEAIATVSAITKLLPWGKYQSALWTALMQVSRHELHERFIVSMICGIIDSFHFNVFIPETRNPNRYECPDEEAHDDGTRKDFIWNQLNKKLIPTIESLLMKDTVERDGSKNKSLRSPIVLALTKLFLKLPAHIFQLKFPRLLTVICQALKNKDSDQRDIARTTLARVATVVDIKYLADIVRELAVSLNDGYKLHVRIAALHSVLFSISKSYKRPVGAKVSNLPFDLCVPAMMDILQQDIFGTASEMKEVETSKKRLVKEAGGMKSLGSLEIIGRMILFQPSVMALSPSNHSSVHALVTPFLSRLHDPEVPSSVIGKVKESMNRIIIGITQNSSAISEEVLPFAYATVSPFIFVEAKTPDNDEDIDDSDDEDMKNLEVSKSNSSQRKVGIKEHSKAVRKVFNWAPSQLKNAKDGASAYEIKIKDKLELRKVQDGANAPKLTGSHRYDSLKSKGKDLNSPATSCAVSLGLGLLHSHLKKYRSSCDERMSDPFVRILFQCVKYSKDNTAVLLSLKCLHVLLRLDLPSVPKYRAELAKCILKILSSMSCNTQNEMVQSGFKTLTLLLGANRSRAIEYLENTDTLKLSNGREKEQNEREKNAILNKGQMSVLVSILQSALTDAEHHNATFGVIKTITARQFISPEYYDLMETIMKMTVQSQKPTMRQVCVQCVYVYVGLILSLAHVEFYCNFVFRSKRQRSLCSI
jgi:U3 small nucleolar RNA-associated protein 20